MSQGKHIGDKAFEQYLQGKSDLTQEYADLPEVKLPDHLDAAILAEAHRAVKSRPGEVKKRNWTTPLSLVATLLVVVMVGLILPDMLQDMQRQQEYAALPQTGSVPASPLPPTTVPPAPVMPAPAPAIQSGQSPASSYIEADAEKSAPGMKREANMLRQEIAQQRARYMTAKQAAEPAKPEQSDARLLADGNALAGGAQALGSLTAAPPASFSGGTMQKELATIPLAAEAKRKAVAVPAADMRDVREDKPAAMAMERPPAPAAAASTQDLAVPAPAEAATADVLPEKAGSLQPHEWIARIRKLMQQGKQSEAARELAEFRKHYPAYKLPDDLSGKK